MGASGSQDANARGVIMLGCVAYSESVCTIWEGMRQYFAAAGVSVDFVLFSSYDRQVEALVRGQIDVAWNGPLAHARIKKRTGGKSLSLGMRDCDRDFTSLLLVRKDVAGLKGLTDLAGKKVATGSYDSPQAYILPLQAVATAGGTALLAQMHVVRFDRDIGKHGDTAAGELEVMQALSKGEVDAGFVSEVMWNRALATGQVNGRGQSKLEALKVLPVFDHCQFDAMPSFSSAKAEAFQVALAKMTMTDPFQANVMRDEGIRSKWETPREEGYVAMMEALASEAAQPFPPPLDTPDAHRFASLDVRVVEGYSATSFARACM